MGTSKKKVEAIYELRRAAEKKAHAERDLAETPTVENRERLRSTEKRLEDKTIDAIDVCHECGHDHEPQAAHVY